MKLKAGVIGSGYWGSKVAGEYVVLRKEGMLDSVVICDKNDSMLKPFADKCETSNDYAKVLKEVDMIHVCTPNSTHYKVAKEALQLGVSVLVEKPMAGNINHAFDLVELSMNNGVVLQVGHVFRFTNIARKVKELYEKGELGKPYYFNLEWAHLIPPIRNVDVVYDLLPHPLDLVNFITGKWPISFDGIGKPFRRSELIEAAFIEAAYDGFFANFHVSWVVPFRKRKLEIIGSKKSITADCVKQTATLYEKSESEDISVDANNTIRTEILNFMESIKTGKNNYNSSIIGARSVEMIDQAMKSIKIVPCQ